MARCVRGVLFETCRGRGCLSCVFLRVFLVCVCGCCLFFGLGVHWLRRGASVAWLQPVRRPFLAARELGVACLELCLFCVRRLRFMWLFASLVVCFVAFDVVGKRDMHGAMCARRAVRDL